MASGKLATFENVAAAAQRIADAGQRPSVRTVIAEMGGGSPNSILPLLNEWKAGRPVVQAPEIAIDPMIAQIIARQITAASLTAAATAEAKAAEVQADADLIAEAGRAAEQLAERLQAELEIAQAQIQQQAGQLAERAAEVIKIRFDAAEHVAAADAKAASERQAAETVRQDLVRAQIRVEAVPRLETEVKDMSGKLETANQALSDARQAAAVATAKLEAEITRAKDAQAREALAREQVSRLEVDLAAVRTLERDGGKRVQVLETEAAELRAQLKIARSRVDDGEGEKK